MNFIQTSHTSQTYLPKPFLTGYFVCGHPTFEKSIELIEASVNAGIDAIEIGIPSNDPYLDGEIIRKAHAHVYDDFNNPNDYIHFLNELRKKVSVPIWIMGYYEDLIKDDLYIKLSKSNTINGFIIPDLSVQNCDAMKKMLHELGVELIPVINHDMSDDTITQYTKDSTITYCQLYKGKTGKAIDSFGNLSAFHQRVRKLTDARLMGGFGIKNAHLTKQVYQSGYDGAVVGSKIVELLDKGNRKELVSFVKELASAKLGEED